MKMGIQIVRVDCAEAEVFLPASQITFTFRAMRKDCVCHHELVEVARVQPDARLHQSILVSAGYYESAKKEAARAIREYREQYAAKKREPWRLPFQLPLKFHK